MVTPRRIAVCVVGQLVTCLRNGTRTPSVARRVAVAVPCAPPVNVRCPDERERRAPWASRRRTPPAEPQALRTRAWRHGYYSGKWPSLDGNNVCSHANLSGPKWRGTMEQTCKVKYVPGTVPVCSITHSPHVVHMGIGHDWRQNMFVAVARDLAQRCSSTAPERRRNVPVSQRTDNGTRVDRACSNELSLSKRVPVSLQHA